MGDKFLSYDFHIFHMFEIIRKKILTWSTEAAEGGGLVHIIKLFELIFFIKIKIFVKYQILI